MTSSSICRKWTRSKLERIDIRTSAPDQSAVWILRRLLRLWRNAVYQAADSALRRPDADCQRHRLFIDLRRQPPFHAVPPMPTAAGRHGPTRCSRIMPNSASASRPYPTTSIVSA